MKQTLGVTQGESLFFESRSQTTYTTILSRNYENPQNQTKD